MSKFKNTTSHRNCEIYKYLNLKKDRPVVLKFNEEVKILKIGANS